MKLLVLGGTKFLGPAVVEGALARGHEVTLFNRGRTNPELGSASGRWRRPSATRSPGHARPASSSSRAGR